MPQVDELSVKVNSDAKSAYAQLDAVVEKLGKINTALASIKNNDGLKNLANVNLGNLFNGVAQSAETQMRKAYVSSRTYGRKIKEELSSSTDSKGIIPKSQKSLMEAMLGDTKSFATSRANILIDQLGIKDPATITSLREGFQGLYEKAFNGIIQGQMPSSAEQQAVQKSFDSLFAKANMNSTGLKIANEEWQELYDTIKNVSRIRVPKEIWQDGILGKNKDGLLIQKYTTDTRARGIDSYFSEWLGEQSTLRSTIQSFADEKGLDITTPTGQAQMLDSFLKSCRIGSEKLSASIQDNQNEVNTFWDKYVETQTKYMNLRKSASDIEKEIRSTYGTGLADTYKDYFANSSSEQLKNTLRALNKTYGELIESKARMEREGTYDSRTYANTIENIIRLEEQRKAIMDKIGGASNKSLANVRYYSNGQDITGDGKNVPQTVVRESQGDFKDTPYDGRFADFSNETIAKLQELENQSAESLTAVREEIESMSSPMDGVSARAQKLQEALDLIKPNINVEDFKNNIYGLEKTFDGLVEKEQEIMQRMANFKLLPNANEDSQYFEKMQIQLTQVRANIAELADEYWRLKGTGGFDINITPFEQAVSKVKADVSGLTDTFRKAKFIIPTDSLKQTEQQIESTRKKIESINAYIEKKSQTTPYYGASQDYKNQTAELETLVKKYDELIAKKEQLYQGGGFTLNYGQISKGLDLVTRGLTKVDSFVNRVGKGFLSFAGKVRSAISPMKAVSKQSDTLSKIGNTLSKSLLRVSNMFKLMLTRMAMRAIIKNVGEAFNSLTQYCETFDANVSMLWNSLKQLGNAIASVADPILQILAPALNYIIQVIISVVNAINQLLSALAGASVWHKAKKQVGSYAKEVAGAGKANKGALQSFDELNNITISDSSGGSGKTTNPSDLWEDEKVDDRWKKISDWLKQLAKDLFEPIKKAWDRVKDYMVESFKFTVSQLLKLFKDIGTDFMTMWGQENTVKLFEGIFLIIGNIVEAVGWLAHNLDEAWNYCKTGLHILETIRDIFLIITSHILKMAYATKKWAKEIDFKPLFVSILKYLRSLRSVVDAVMGVFEGFYTRVLLPLAKWTIEKGLPELLDVFTDFNNKVDWYAIEDNFNRLWDALEPFAETIGEGLILFIKDLTDVIADFLNGDTFSRFVDGFEEWSKNISAEDVCRTIEQVIFAILALKGSIFALKGASGVFSTIATLSQAGLGEVIIAIAPVALAVAGFGLALILAYNKSEKFRDSVKKLASDIKDNAPNFSDLGETLGDLSENVGKLLENFGDLASKIVDDLNPAIVDFFDEIGADAKVMSDLIDFVGDLIDLLDKLYTIMQNIKNLNFGEAFKGIDEILNGTKYDSGKKLAKSVIDAKAPVLGNAIDAYGVAKEKSKWHYGKTDLSLGSITKAMSVASDMVFGTSFNKSKTSSSDTDGTLTIGVDVRGDEAVKNAGKTIAEISQTCKNEAPVLKLHTDADTEELRGTINGAFDDVINASQNAKTGQLLDTSYINDFSSSVSKSTQEVINISKEASDGFKDYRTQSVESMLGVKTESTNLATTYKENTSSMVKQTESVTDGLKTMNTDGTKQVSDFKKNLDKIFEGVGDVFEKIGKKISGLMTNINNFNNVGGTKYIGTGTEGKVGTSVHGFASGGYPMTGQMFLARENGIPELVGSIGNQTAVANNTQIIQGITDGVEAGNQQGNIYMSSMVNLLQAIVDKPSGITNADIFNSVRNSNRIYKRSTGHSAF